MRKSHLTRSCPTCRRRVHREHICPPRLEVGRRVTEKSAWKWGKTHRDPKHYGDRLADGFAWMEGEEPYEYDEYNNPIPGGYYDS
jgi:hypothetical protein